VGIFITRDDVRYLAVKAGDNNDSHNHNDTGSFTIYKYGKPLLIDVGVETYTKKTFSPERYEIWTMQSRYHNLPSFLDGNTEIIQKDGADFAAKNVSYELSSSVCSITMDIAGAYPDKRIHSYQRTAVMKKGQPIVIKDHYEGDLLQPVLSLMFYEDPILEGNRIIIGDLGSVSVAGCSHMKKECLPITDDRLKTTWKHDIYRVLVTMDTNDLVLTIE